jgi:flagellar basal body rod protein FlgG
MDPSSIALQALQQANTQLETAAARIASVGAGSADRAPVDVADLSATMVALLSAQSAFEVNLAALKTVDEMKKSLLDLKA